MRVGRGLIAVAGLLIALGVGLVSVSSAHAVGTIWPECISGSVSQPCQTSSWYTGPVAVVWDASPSPEETSPCLLGIEYPFDADNVANLLCSAKWKTEGSDTRTLTLHVEVSTPTIAAAPARPPDANSWYNHPVAIAFNGQGYSGIASCQTATPSATAVYSGPDAASASVHGTCVDPAGKSASTSFELHYDATPPTITGAFPSRPPDFNGWYNHPVTFVFTGMDATSGIEPCSATYAGPDSSSARLLGSCRDRAGNVTPVGVSLRYEAAPPQLSVGASPGDGTVSVRWRANTNVVIARSPGLRGPHASTLYSGSSGSFTDKRVRNGVRYTYTLKAKGRAGRVSKRSIALVPGPQLLAPTTNARVVTPPLLRWTPVKGATYYNVQLFRGQKLLSAWPVRSSLQLSRAWKYAGVENRLAAGRYTWYVWPGYGAIGTAQYGSLIGHRTFIVHSAASG
jgi:hypothetical protein